MGDTMKMVNITNAMNNLYKLVKDVNDGTKLIKIVNDCGKNAILISEDEWKNIYETLYLSSIPGYVNDIKKINDEENWNIAKEYNPYEEWNI